METRSDCCDPERLQLLVEDRLSPAGLTSLEEHLGWCAECRSELDRLVVNDGSLTVVRRHLGVELIEAYESSPTVDESLGFLTQSDWPDSIGRLGTYEVKGVLGRGGMGVVLKAFDPALSRNVAIKVLSSSLATCGAARRRFLREARAAAAVVHEHVVGVFAVVESAGLPFLVMEYVPGRSLQDRLDRQGALSLPEVLRIGTQTAAGLAAAHAQGLVHRDVKPANILLENGVERVRLSDFGLARAAADAGLTFSGVVAGTPHYMAPEQASGESTDHRADLFSLGSTLYAMCAGHPPFRAETPLGVLRRVCDDQPRPIRDINPEVPEWLEAIIFRLMDKDPATRFQSATEVANLLEHCLAHVQQPLSTPLPAELETGQRRAGFWYRAWSRPTLIALAITGLTAAVLALIPSSSWKSGALLQRLESPSASEPPLATSSAPPGVRPDEIAHQLQEAWGLAGIIEANLHRGEALPNDGPITSLAHDLDQQLGSLEREIASNRELSGRRAFVRPKPVTDRRR